MTAPKLLFSDPPAGLRTGQGPSLRRALTAVALIWLATRLIAWIGAYHGAFTLFRIEQGLDPPLEKHQRALQDQFIAERGPAYESARELLTNFEPLCRFAGVHYESILDEGYHYAPPPPGTTDRNRLEQNIAFFPLFPLAARPLASFLGAHAAMITVSHVCSLAAAILLYLWIRWRSDHAVAIYTVALTFCWPAAVYYSYAYAESVTLLTFVAALWAMDAGRWWVAAIACALATATRPTALAISAVLVLAYLINRRLPWRARLRWASLLGVVGVAGIAAYALFLTVQYGSPLVYIDNFKAGWVPDRHRADWIAFLTFTPVWEQFKYFRNLVAFAPPVGLVNAPNTLMWNTPLNLFLLFLSIGGLWRVPASFRPLLALGPLIFLHAYAASGGAQFGIEPIARYMALALPALVVLAAWCVREWRSGARTVVFVFLILVHAAWAYRFGLREWSG